MVVAVHIVGGVESNERYAEPGLMCVLGRCEIRRDITQRRISHQPSRVFVVRVLL
jgi:hypothetical protein